MDPGPFTYTSTDDKQSAVLFISLNEGSDECLSLHTWKYIQELELCDKDINTNMSEPYNAALDNS